MSIDSRDQTPPPEPLREVDESDRDRTDTSKRDEGQTLVDDNRQPFDSQRRPLDIEKPAGTWEVPDTRTYGNPINEQYENWTRTATGAPEGMEYPVSNENRECWFDTRYVEDRNGEPTEVLVDAKGDYAQFIDNDTGDWKDFWKNPKDSGHNGQLLRAQHQVEVADGRPVEWWCMQPEAAEKLNEAFENNPALSGKVVAVHRPMPERDT
jgi:hypothetical protein